VVQDRRVGAELSFPFTGRTEHRKGMSLGRAKSLQLVAPLMRCGIFKLFKAESSTTGFC